MASALTAGRVACCSTRRDGICGDIGTPGSGTSVTCLQVSDLDPPLSFARSSRSFLSSSSARRFLNANVACDTSCLRAARRAGSRCSGSAVISRSMKGSSDSRASWSRRDGQSICAKSHSKAAACMLRKKRHARLAHDDGLETRVKISTRYGTGTGRWAGPRGRSKRIVRAT